MMSVIAVASDHPPDMTLVMALPRERAHPLLDGTSQLAPSPCPPDSRGP